MDRTYPQGVPCWIDLAPADLDAATAFYGALFGWEFHDAMPPGAPLSYLVATKDGRDAAALGTGDGSAGWTSYIACDDADATATLVEEAGGTIVEPPEDAGPGGRTATCRDPQGAVFRLWQAKRRLGAQIVNEDGSWNFSDLHTEDVEGSAEFYGAVFDWRRTDDLGAGMFRLAGYGDHLEATVYPDIHEVQSFAPEGFDDVVAGVTEEDGPARWWIRFSVDDRDAAVARVQKLGGTVRDQTQTEWTREAVVTDPEGNPFILSELVMPE